MLVAAAPEKAADQSAVFGSPMKKFIMDERCGQQPLAFTAWDQETEARGQGGAHLFAETECDRDRRTVWDPTELRGNICAHASERGGSRRCRCAYDHRIEVFGRVARGHDPAPFLSSHRLHARVCAQRVRGKPLHYGLRELLHSVFQRSEY